MPKVIRTTRDMTNLLLHPDWRKWPMQYDVPAESQIFGYLVYLSGIEGIVYPSKMTGKDCIALFPRNFRD